MTMGTINTLTHTEDGVFFCLSLSMRCFLFVGKQLKVTYQLAKSPTPKLVELAGLANILDSSWFSFWPTLFGQELAHWPTFCCQLRSLLRNFCCVIKDQIGIKNAQLWTQTCEFYYVIKVHKLGLLLRHKSS